MRPGGEDREAMAAILEKDPFFVLGIAPGANLAEIKQAYRARARAEHPDKFPAAERQRQQLRMMDVNQAYLLLLSSLTAHSGEESPAPVGDLGPTGPVSPGDVHAGRAAVSSYPGIPARRGAGGRDPAYELYRQGYGFLARARALMNARRNLDEAEIRMLHLTGALEALRFSGQAYRCFLNVLTGYPESIWTEDALEQMEAIERINRIYQRMCENSLGD